MIKLRLTLATLVSLIGALNLSCTTPGPDCFPIKMVDMFIGKYGGALPGQKVSNPNATSNPSRNIWFCAGLPCTETDAGAVPSGWIGPSD